MLCPHFGHNLVGGAVDTGWASSRPESLEDTTLAFSSVSKDERRVGFSSSANLVTGIGEGMSKRTCCSDDIFGNFDPEFRDCGVVPPNSLVGLGVLGLS